MTRHFWLLVHRYAGLFMAAFLVVIGLTGSIIVFNQELSQWLSPRPSVEVSDVPMLDATILREKALALVPHARINMLDFYVRPGWPYIAWLEPETNPATGQPYDLPATVLYLDPHTGAELKREKVSEDVFPVTQQNLMRFIYSLHTNLAIPGSFGRLLFGVVALVWTIDCFVGAYLTFPLRVRRKNSDATPAPAKPRRSWVTRWWNPAWLVKWRGSFYRVNFDLHRAGGLWVWVMLLALAWSSVGFNLRSEVYAPVMKTMFGMPDPYGGDLPDVPKPQSEPRTQWGEAHRIAQALASEQARLQGFTVDREDWLMYMPEKGVFGYCIHTSRDLLGDYCGTNLLFDDRDGAMRSISVPTGQNPGTTLDSWVVALHVAAIWGLPFRIFVTCMGIIVAMLSVTGVYIWIKKRGARMAA